MSKDTIQKMVDRFLRWNFPENFCPDGGIKFDRVVNGKDREYASAWWPVGTNLLSAEQAREMIEYLINTDEENPK